MDWSIVGWIAGLVFVYLFGLFEGRGQGYKRRKAEETQEKQDQPSPEPVTVDDPGLLRIKVEDGMPLLDLDGARVDTTSLSGDQRKRLIEMLNLMRPWLEGRPAAPAPAIAPTPPPPPASPAPAPVMPSPASAAAPSSPAPIPVPTASAPAAKKEEPAEAAPTSMVGQINMLLQARIANTKFASQGVSMMESLSGGVNVYVGLNRYEGIDEIPDEEVKALIRAAIAEWEKKYTPGL